MRELRKIGKGGKSVVHFAGVFKAEVTVIYHWMYKICMVGDMGTAEYNYYGEIGCVNRRN